MSQLEAEFEFHLRAARLAFGCLSEFKFHPTRRWRFDFAWPEKKLAVEIEGGVWTGGRHTRGKGFSEDCEKYSEAAVLGWRIIRVTGDQVRSGKAIQWVGRALS